MIELFLAKGLFLFFATKKSTKTEFQDHYNKDRQGPIAATTVIINIFRNSITQSIFFFCHFLGLSSGDRLSCH